MKEGQKEDTKSEPLTTKQTSTAFDYKLAIEKHRKAAKQHEEATRHHHLAALQYENAVSKMTAIQKSAIPVSL